MPEEIKPTESKPKPEIHTFVVVDEKGNESGTFHGRQPRQAALKVANSMGGTKDKPIEFRIRARGEKKLHIFKGYTEMVKTPEKRPAWMKPIVRKPFVTKMGVVNPERPAKKPKKESPK